MRKIKVIRVVAAVVALGFAGWGYSCAWHTFVRWWVPVALALLIGGGICRVLVRPASRLMPGCGRAVVMGIAALWAASVVYGAGLAMNYYLADESTARTVEATVIGRHSEERSRYRRLGPRLSVRDGSYKVYYLTLGFDNGETREVAVSAGEYSHTRKGQIRHFTLERGFLGCYVFKNN